MIKRVLLLALIGACLAVFAPSHSAVALLPGAITPLENASPGIVQQVDTFKTCQQIHWCGARRDGTPYCGPTLRCRTCKFVRTCTRALGCVWEEKCRWGPYQPVIQQ